MTTRHFGNIWLQSQIPGCIMLVQRAGLCFICTWRTQQGSTVQNVIRGSKILQKICCGFNSMAHQQQYFLFVYGSPENESLIYSLSHQWKVDWMSLLVSRTFLVFRSVRGLQRSPEQIGSSRNVLRIKKPPDSPSTWVRNWALTVFSRFNTTTGDEV